MRINGSPVIIVDNRFLPVIGYEQARKHRKRRINKKWRKRYGMKPVHDTNFCAVMENPFGGKTILMAQKVYNKLKESENHDKT